MVHSGAGENRALSCARAKRLIAEHADGSLDEASAAILRHHLAGCRGCARWLEEEYAQISLLESTFAPKRLSDERLNEFKRAILGKLPRQVEHVYLTRPGYVRIGPIEFRLSFWLPVAATAAVLLLAIWFRPITVARIAELGGQVAIQRAGSAQWRQTAGRAELRAGDGIRTESASASLAFRDGTRVELEPFSEIALARKTEGQRQVVQLREGKIDAQVAHADSAFTVETSYGRISVLGTRFRATLRNMTLSQMSAMEVSVTEGAVKLSNDLGFRTVRVGERFFVGSKTNPELMGTPAEEEAAASLLERVIGSLPSSVDNADRLRASMGDLLDLLAAYPNSRWADDALWLLCFIEPTYALQTSGQEFNVDRSIQLCSEWARRYGKNGKLEARTLDNFPTLLRRDSVASRSYMASSPAELSSLLSLQQGELHWQLARWLLADGRGRPEEALASLQRGLEMLEASPQPTQWLRSLSAEIDSKIREDYSRLQTRLQSKDVSAPDAGQIGSAPTAASSERAPESLQEPERRGTRPLPQPASQKRTRLR